jgi:anti-sigma-K factor RskA
MVMSERPDEFRHLCALYALGSLDEAEAARFEAHLRTGCSACEAELAQCFEATYVLAKAVASPPDPALRARVLQDIANAADSPARSTSDAPVRPRHVALPPNPGRRDRRIVRFPAIVATLGWAAAIAAAILGAVEQRVVRQLESEMTALRVQQTQLESQLLEERRWATTMASPAARTAVFAPTGAGGSNVSGWALYDPSTQRAIVVLENLQLEPGHDFELWAIGPRGPRSLGVIQVEFGGRAVVRLTRVVVPADLAAFAVSYEAAGGSPNPTAPAGPVVMVGNL